MNQKHRKILRSIFQNPIQANIKWKDIENLFIGFGAELSEGSGSRIRVHLNGVKAVFHRPHPKREANKGTLVSVRIFLNNAGINNDEI